MATNDFANIPTAASGKVVQAQGVGVAPGFSTATYPSTAGASGNVLTSDGTNWISSAPTGATKMSYSVACGLGSPADAFSYSPSNGASLTTFLPNQNASTRIYMPFAGNVDVVFGALTVKGTLASAENTGMRLTLNGFLTSGLISGTLTLNKVEVPFSTTSLGVVVAVGDYLEFRLVCPIWATNPTNVSLSATFFVT